MDGKELITRTPEGHWGRASGGSSGGGEVGQGDLSTATALQTAWTHAEDTQALGSTRPMHRAQAATALPVCFWGFRLVLRAVSQIALNRVDAWLCHTVHRSPCLRGQYGCLEGGSQTHYTARESLFFIQVRHGAGDTAKLSLTVSGVYPQMRLWVRERAFIYDCEAVCINSPNSPTRLGCLRPSIFQKMSLEFAPVSRVS